MTKPQPVVVTTVCSLCDQPWEAHGDKPTTEDCIRLLKVELAKRPAYRPWVQPFTPTYPQWTYTISTGNATGNATASNTAGSVVQFKRPEDPPEAITAVAS